jgi:hypothetical protein
MPRDLVTVSQLIRETQTDLEHATVAVNNAEATLVRVRENQEALLARFDGLVAEHAEAVAEAKAKGLRQPEPSAGAAFDSAAAEARVTEAFERATTPQGQTAGFSNGQSF